MKLLLVCSPEDESYLSYMKAPLSGHSVTVRQDCPEFILPLTTKYEAILCSNEQFLNRVIQKSRHVSLKDYAGSYVLRNGTPFLFLNPLAQIHTVPYGRFLLERYLTKVTKPWEWQNSIPFQFEEVTNEARFNHLYTLAQASLAISIDIETVQEPEKAITICSYGLIREYDEKINLINFTFAINSTERYQWMRSLNELPVPKIFQNGIYDNSWFLRYGSPPRNWSFDTMDLFHSWYSELPKRLDFVTSFCVRESWFWKNDGKSGKWEDYCEYGCRDVWATSCSFLYLIEHMPEWAIRNYVAKFPVNFPSLLAGVRGWRIDEKIRDALKDEKLPEIEEARKELGQVVGNSSFNPGSPKQVTAFLSILSNKPITSSDEKTIEKVGSQHPLNERLCRSVLSYREQSKIVSTYLNARLIHGRFLYSLSPSGTDTGRLSSRGSFLWSGGNVQNIPRGSVVKSCFISDDGYFLAEADGEQAESRCTAYLSGDKNLIETVESKLDFHRINAQRFFGVPYEEIDKELRDLSKRVTHGSTYNMGENVLIQTMGANNILRAQKLLNLPKQWTLKTVATHLLESYSKAYPTIKGLWYETMKDKVRATHRLTSPLGWTRWFFAKPWEDKLALNAMVAHAPQNLSASILNKSFLNLFKLEKRTNGQFKLLCQIHDSCVFQYKIGRIDLALEAAKLMEIPTKVKDCKNMERIMVIPIALKGEAVRWSDLQEIKRT